MQEKRLRIRLNEMNGESCADRKRHGLVARYLVATAVSTASHSVAQ